MTATITPIDLARELAHDEAARPVPGASRYWITDHGRVFSVVAALREMKPTPDRKGYSQADLRRDDARARTRPTRWRPYVHELVALAFIGPRPAAPGVAYEIDHLDGDKRNNRADNLQYVTRAENRRRAVAAGRVPSVKLSAVDVWIYRCASHADREADVVDRMVHELGLTARAARKALAGRAWAAVPDPASRPTAVELARALMLDTEAEAGRFLRLSPFSEEYTGESQTAARVLPFRSSTAARAA